MTRMEHTLDGRPLPQHLKMFRDDDSLDFAVEMLKSGRA